MTRGLATGRSTQTARAAGRESRTGPDPLGDRETGGVAGRQARRAARDATIVS